MRCFWLAAAIFIFGQCVVRGMDARADSSDYSEESALKAAFRDAGKIEKKRLWFSEEERERLSLFLDMAFREKTLPVYVAKGNGGTLGYAFIDHVIGKTEQITYMVVLSPEGAVMKVKILAFREPQGYEVRNEKWRDQFVGKKHGSPLALGKDIDVISGATLSCRAITKGVKKILAVFRFFVEEK